ncbi:AsnC family transcriptional regulator [Haladaptatus sp. NG-SE-30]
MAELDSTDREILQLLLEDAKRSYRDIGDQVGLSPPTISDRIERLEELGVIRGFTLNLDRSKLTDGEALFIHLRVNPGYADEVVSALHEFDSVEHVVQTIDDRVYVQTHMDDTELQRLVSEVVGPDVVEEFDVRKVLESSWRPDIGEGDLVTECDECGKPIEGEGVSVTLEDRQYFLCCPSCESLLRDRYEKFREEST